MPVIVCGWFGHVTTAEDCDVFRGRTPADGVTVFDLWSSVETLPRMARQMNQRSINGRELATHIAASAHALTRLARQQMQLAVCFEAAAGAAIRGAAVTATAIEAMNGRVLTEAWSDPTGVRARQVPTSVPASKRQPHRRPSLSEARSHSA